MRNEYLKINEIEIASLPRVFHEVNPIPRTFAIVYVLGIETERWDSQIRHIFIRNYVCCCCSCSEPEDTHGVKESSCGIWCQCKPKNRKMAIVGNPAMWVFVDRLWEFGTTPNAPTTQHSPLQEGILFWLIWHVWHGGGGNPF